ncbi:hypothetical protein R4J17_06340 [Brachyspira intermedia]|uniref:hypothetical protein n=1 Tax=Brachyspira TaxID=29521 RepID=UPI00262DF172|nr:hypothetical protein [uncultured Brachyspira sp.]
MNLLEQAKKDLRFTLEDINNGFGTEFQFNDGTKIESIICNVSDIGFFLDTNTMAGVSSRQVEITCCIETLKNKGFAYPSKNWILSYINTNNEEFYFSIKQIRPDRTLGIYNLVLEIMKIDKIPIKE